jgi:probable F420-dependent oxidoreductase
MKFIVSTAFSDPAHYLPIATKADACGWDYVTISDHVAHPAVIASKYPYTEDGSLRWEEDTPWPDPWVAIGAMAGVTERIRFVTNIFVLPMRNPLLAAKSIGTAAVLSGDRVSLGVGVGWMKEEFELAGQDFHTRGKRTDEMIEIMRKLWTGERVEHHGRHYDFGPVRMLPAPAAPVPIYVGGLSEAALRRTARLGDGWVSDLHSTEEFREIIGRLRQYREECGRGSEPLDVIAACTDAFDVDGYRRLEEIGVTHLQTQPWIFYSGKTERLEDKLDGLARFSDEIVAKLR